MQEIESDATGETIKQNNPIEGSDNPTNQNRQLDL